MPLYAFDARRSYLNGYYAANFAVPGTNEVGKRLSAYDARRRYLSRLRGLGDDIVNTDPTMIDASNTLTPPVYTAPDLPLVLVPSSAGDPSMISSGSTLTAPAGSSSSPAAAASAAAAAAASALAARNQAAIVNPALLVSPTSSLSTLFSSSNLPLIALAIGGVVLLSSGGKKRR
jgi:hypothetical protein